MWGLWLTPILFILGAYWFFGHIEQNNRAEIIESRSDEKVEQAVGSLLAEITAEADRLFEEKKYTTPEERNAWRLYRVSLEIDPENEEAISKLDSMATIYLDWGGSAFELREYEKAKNYYDKASLVARRNSRISIKVSEALEELKKIPFGRRWQNSLGIEFARISAGTFRMGSPSGESGRDNDEGPVHRVTISRDFYMGITEVTQRQWLAVMGTNPSHFSNCGNDCPVETVSWFDVVKFCNRLSEREGLKPAYRRSSGITTWDKSADGYRLPTEAEWEYACRAGTTTRFYTGNSDSDLDHAGWYKENSGSMTHPVGQKAPNAWGLYDMHGNVWEWCWDWFDKYSSALVIDPEGSTRSSVRVVRGGSWYNFASLCRSAHRFRCQHGYGDEKLGFRLLRPINH